MALPVISFVTALAATSFTEPQSSAHVPSAQESKAVRVGVIPDPALVERDDKGQCLNCDFRVENRRGEKIRLTGIEVSTIRLDYLGQPKVPNLTESPEMNRDFMGMMS